jgi:hypothetical protein
MRGTTVVNWSPINYKA